MRNVFERSANRNNTNNVACCNSAGNLNNNAAINGNYAAPDCVAKTRNEALPMEKALATQRKEPSSCREICEQEWGDERRACGPATPPASPTIEDAISYDALMESARRCYAGVLWKDSVTHFYLHADEEVGKLCDELHAGTYRLRPPRTFRITHPKPRTINSVAFRDRVVQRSFNDNVIYPLVSRSWIHDNYACQHGKGTDFARERMRCHLERHLRDHGDVGGTVQIDVSGYYASLLLMVIHQRFLRKMPDFATDFAMEVIESQGDHSPGDRFDPYARGIYAGSQTSQIAGVDYLDPIDHYVKEGLGIRGYGRYMDDSILIHEDMDHLADCLYAIGRRLGSVGLTAHPKKTRMRPLSKGFTFLGFDYRVQGGHVRMYVAKEKVKEQRRHLRGLARRVRDGRVTVDDYLQSLQCMVQHDAKGDAMELPERLRAYGLQLIEGGS